jgi:hypothetical protein
VNPVGNQTSCQKKHVLLLQPVLKHLMGNLTLISKQKKITQKISHSSSPSFIRCLLSGCRHSMNSLQCMMCQSSSYEHGKEKLKVIPFLRFHLLYLMRRVLVVPLLAGCSAAASRRPLAGCPGLHAAASAPAGRHRRP